MNALRRLSLFIALGLVCLLSAAPAHAAIERSGVWPPDERVSLTLSEVPRSEAVRRLAEEAGWSLVQQGVGKDPVSLSVKDEPADKVLLMVLSGQDGVIERDGSLVSIRGASATPDASAEPAAAKPLATPKGPEEDLFVPETGHIGKDESARDVFVFGSVVIEGTVTGSVVVFGGEARLKKGARVRDDVIAFGGVLDIEDGVQIGGDVAALFGTLKRGTASPEDCVACIDEKKDPWAQFFETFFEDLTRSALAWLLGALLIALAPARVEQLRGEMERRPLRNLGLGLLGALGLLLTVATLAITIVGIPLAIVVLVLSLVAMYLTFCVVPLALGRRVAGARSQNPYMHLAIGCGLLVVLLTIPVVGELVSFAGTMIAIGALVRTRATLRPAPAAPGAA